jgi:hypothetical protein
MSLERVNALSAPSLMLDLFAQIYSGARIDNG